MPGGWPMLPDLQRRLALAIRDGATDGFDGLLAGGRLSAAARLSIHVNHYRTSLTAALAATFETVHLRLGPDDFGRLARGYVVGCPPAGPVLADYGDDFPDHVAATLPRHGQAELADLARLDLAIARCFHAPDEPPLRPEHLAAIAPADLDGLRLRLHPVVRLVGSAYPIGALWRAARQGAPVADRGPTTLLVRRRDDDVGFEALRPEQAALLASLAAGTPLGLAMTEADASLFAGFAAAGLFAGMPT